MASEEVSPLEDHVSITQDHVTIKSIGEEDTDIDIIDITSQMEGIVSFLSGVYNRSSNPTDPLSLIRELNNSMTIGSDQEFQNDIFSSLENLVKDVAN